MAKKISELRAKMSTKASTASEAEFLKLRAKLLRNTLPRALPAGR